MRKIVLALIVAFGVAGSYAQNEAGKFSIKPLAGVNISTFSGGMEDMYHMKFGFAGGIEAEYGVTPWMGLSLGMVYSQQGAKMDGGYMLNGIDDKGNSFVAKVSVDGKLKCNYINLPLMANFYIPQVRGLSIKAGVQVGFLTDDEMTANGGMVWHVDNRNATGYNPVLEDNDNVFWYMKTSDVCKSVDVGFPIGLSYEYKNVVLDARYYIGLTKIDKTEDAEDCRNRCPSVTLGYRFRL